MEHLVRRRAVSASVHLDGRVFAVIGPVTPTTTGKIVPNGAIARMVEFAIQSTASVRVLPDGPESDASGNAIQVGLGRTARRAVIAIWRILWPVMRPLGDVYARQIGVVG